MSQQFNLNTKSLLVEISNQYKSATTRDLPLLIAKLNDLTTPLLNETDNGLISQILVYIADHLPRNEPRLLASYTNLVTYLTEKSIIRLASQDLNHQFSFLLDLFRSIPPASTHDTLNIHDLFRAIGSVIYKTTANLSKNNLEKLISDKHGLLTNSLDLHQSNDRIYLIVVQCIYNLTLGTSENDFIDDTAKLKCFRLLIRVLHMTKAVNFNEAVYSRILIKSLQGIENLLQAINLLPTDLVADILAVLKTLSFYGLNNLQANPQVTQIQVVPLKQTSSLIVNESTTATAGAQHSDSETEGASRQSNNNSQIKRKRFTKKTASNQQTQQAQDPQLPPPKDVFHQVPLIDKNYNGAPSTSESEYSDSEATASAAAFFTAIPPKFNSQSTFLADKNNAKVRLAAVNSLQTAFKIIDKRTILSYWDSFIPSDLNAATQGSLTAYTPTNMNLITILLHDYSPKVRVYAAQTLGLFLDSIRNLFQIANEQHTIQVSPAQSSFISQSYKMTIIIKNLLATFKHVIQKEERKENYLNLIELLKCLNQLIRSIPFDKLKPGLLLKLIEFLLRYLFFAKKTYHTSAIKQASLACLTTLVSLKNVEIDLILKNKLNPVRAEPQDAASLSGTLTPQLEQLNLNSYMKQLNQNQPNKVTYFYSASSSTVLSGAHTPTATNTNYEASESVHGCWLIDYAVQNANSIEQSPDLRVGCLNLLINLCKNYFHLFYIEQLNQLEALFLRNLSQSIQQQHQQQEILLTLKLLEELTRYLSTDKVRANNQLDLSQCVKLWLRLIDDTFLTKRYLVDEKNYLICSQVCDCLAASGSDIYEQLPLQQVRLNLMINLLSLTKSQSNVIRAASIRALGVYITYPSLKEDFKFIYDLIDCIMAILTNDTNNLVKQKCTWSLSNLSEILIENKDKLGTSFVQNFNSMIFFRLLRLTTEICARESDKIKSYLVRTLGNLLNYVTEDFINCVDNDEGGLPPNRNRFVLTKLIVEEQITRSIECLIQCRSAKMLKVKWNLCHSFGIVLRNSHVLSKNSWQMSIYEALMDFFVANFNYKIKINSIIALMQLQKREHGFNSAYSRLWSCLFKTLFSIYFDNRLNDDRSNEFEHKNTLIQQMCKFFTYLCKYLKISDLGDVESKIKEVMVENNLLDPANPIKLIDTKLSKQIKIYLNNYIYDVLKDSENLKQEVQFYNEALNQLNLMSANLKASNENEVVNLLRYLLKKSDFSVNLSNDAQQNGAARSSEQHTDDSDAEYLPVTAKYPFKQTYD